jgi:hypothetical protein
VEENAMASDLRKEWQTFKKDHPSFESSKGFSSYVFSKNSFK